jgi:hypothetical protein
MNDNVEKFEVKMDEKGNLIINPYEYLENLSDEKKNEFLWDGGWWCLVESHIVESIIKSFGTENYNEKYHRFRSLLLNSEAMPEVIRRWAKDMIELRYQSKQYAEYWELAYRELHSFTEKLWREIDNDRGVYSHANYPKLPKSKYGVDYPKELIEEAHKKAAEWGLLFSEPEEDTDDLNLGVY